MRRPRTPGCARPALAPVSILATTFMFALDLVELDLVEPDLVEPEERPLQRATERGARAVGTSCLSFFAPPGMAAPARDAGFREARQVPSSDPARRCFAGRTDCGRRARRSCLSRPPEKHRTELP
ncbi:hypothetical protein ABZV31_07315 [Streptomyces sp. NPDC005202]|uniref:hypothetical protein n=1 Tax=Streptomyces sp. NPDC005202 TaxID=3157021 RepID=UPI0033AA36D3